MLTFPFPSKQTGKNLVLNPVVSLEVQTAQGWQSLWFLIDSGADRTMVTTELLKALGIKYDQKKKIKLLTINNLTVGVYEVEINIKFGPDIFRVRAYATPKGKTPLLLGRLDIFDRFAIEFNPLNKIITFTKVI